MRSIEYFDHHRLIPKEIPFDLRVDDRRILVRRDRLKLFCGFVGEDAGQMEMTAAGILYRFSIPHRSTRVSIGFVVVKPLVTFRQMFVSEEVIVRDTTTNDLAIIVLDHIEFATNLSLIVVLGFEERLSVETGQSIDTGEFRLLPSRAKLTREEKTNVPRTDLLTNSFSWRSN